MQLEYLRTKRSTIIPLLKVLIEISKTCRVLQQHNLKLRNKEQFSLPTFPVLDAFTESARSKNDSSLVG